MQQNALHPCRRTVKVEALRHSVFVRRMDVANAVFSLATEASQDVCLYKPY
jgi:hypothetical protein